ncbi:hypothetical protein BB561_001789 [Smittium simulii]|uniref:TatD related DNase n=1 Tax=Smittium simulii TaxID=133385 RepID=A0A2T9YT27_9FUNG|nr:hypothetical protein BB561_001789 [Smittium simulii]
MECLVDAHCHFQQQKIEFESHLRKQADGTKYYIMGTNYYDWADVASLARVYPKQVVPGFGIHPWFVNWVIKGEQLAKESTSANIHCPGNSNIKEAKAPSSIFDDKNQAIPVSWENTLIEYLEEFPDAIVGEFGLDRTAVDRETLVLYDWNKQVEIFYKQYKIAALNKRSVSLHCVRAHQQLYDLLASIYPPKQKKPKPSHLNLDRNEQSITAMVNCAAPVANIMLHSYSGSAEMLVRFFKLPDIGRRIYISLSQLVNMRSANRTKLVVAKTPSDRILIESDIESPANAKTALAEICCFLSSALQLPLDSVQYLTTNNALNFILPPSI